MKWTSETPTKPGMYWHKSNKFIALYEARVNLSGQLIVKECGGGLFKLADLMIGKWAGPLEPPAE